MKNYNFSCFVFFILFSQNLIAQKVIFKEDFADTAKNWTIISKGDGFVWTWLNSPAKTWFSYIQEDLKFTTYNNGYMIFNSDSAANVINTNNQNSELTLKKPIDCSNVTFVQLKFEQHAKKNINDTFRVAVSNDSIIWVDTLMNLQLAQNDETPNVDIVYLDITNVAAGQPKVYLKFQFRGEWEYWWAIDDIEVFEPCKTDKSTFILTDVSCKGFMDGSINFTPIGTLPFTFNWSNGDTTEDVINLLAGSYNVTITDSTNCKSVITVNVNEPTLPVTVSKLKTDVACIGGNDGIVEVNVTGGTTPYLYKWSESSTSDKINNLTKGNYFITVTDAKGCFETDSFQLKELQIKFVSISGDSIICVGGTGILNASNGFASYLWSDGATFDSLLIDTAKKYSISAIGADGCSSVDTFEVVFYPILKVSLGNDTSICFQDSIILNAGSGFVSYAWNNSSTNSTLKIYETKKYFVTITDSNSCKNSDTLNLLINALPVFDIGNDTSICKGDTVTFIAKSGFTSYNWSDGGTTFKISVANAGTYFIEVTDSNTCQSLDSVKLKFHPESKFSLGKDTLICTEDSILIDAGSMFISYLWNNGKTTQNIFGKKGNYNIDIIDTNTCHAYDTIIISNFSIPVINIGNDTSFCKGNSIKIDAGSGFSSYLWSNGETTQQITVDSTNVYSVKIKDVNSCINWDSILAIVNELPLIDLGPKVVMCELDTFDISVTGVYVSYNWSTGETTNTITVKEPGKYTVTVFDGNGCEGSSTKQVLFIPAPESELKDLDTLSCPGDSIVLDAGSGFVYYLWNDGKNDQSRTIFFPDTGLYTVIMFDVNFCGAQDSIYIRNYIPEDRELTCFQGQHLPFDDFVTIYPNPPISGQIAVAFNDLEEEDISLTLYNYTGQIVFFDEIKNYTGDYEKPIDIRHFPKGLYILQIYVNNSMLIRKIVNPLSSENYEK